MIVYSATKDEFRADVRENRIEDAILTEFQRRLGHSTSQAEIRSWKNSMLYMSNVLDDDGIPANAGVAIEYRIPQTSKRVDFIVTGRNGNDRGAAVIVELKQWSDVEATDKEGIVRAFVGGAVREVPHPSYQAWTYAALLRDFNENVQKAAIALEPCAYLHNLESALEIQDDRYLDHLAKAPTFVRADAVRLAAFIKQHIKHGDDRRLLFQIENSRIRPSKNLADELASLLKGNQEFMMIDDQKVVFETAITLTGKATGSSKQVLIVEGGPGTGKSVVAVNLLVRLTERQLLTQYVTRNAAPRAVYESVLTGSFKKSHITNLFSGSGAYTATAPNTFDGLIVDEAHRLNEKSGLYQNLGENQIKEIIEAAKFSVFFIDEDQRVTWKDVGTAAEIERWATFCGASVHRLELQSQFRCNGSDGYLAWLDHALQVRETANEDLDGIDFDFRVCSSPNEMMALIEGKNEERNKARAVAGYCWDWITKKPDRAGEYDIVIEEHGFRRRWNLSTDGSLWIRMPDSVNEVGCIHTCQGLEVDYVGVIVGPDLVVRNGQVVTRPEHRSKMDSSIKGYKTARKQDAVAADARADLIIKNTYRTLMSRGQKGCYVYCTDPETNAYFEGMAALVAARTADEPVIELLPEQGLPGRRDGMPLRVLGQVEAVPYQNCVPVLDLKAAAGGFHSQAVETLEWVELPEEFRPREGLFVAQVLGESMNRRIPDGSWCLFSSDRGGSREGKIVLVEHRLRDDPETGGRYTVKRYHSEKGSDDGAWRHSTIVLSPESTLPHHDEIIFRGDEVGDLRVVGVLVAIVG
jgi:DUF2075 family protein